MSIEIGSSYRLGRYKSPSRKMVTVIELCDGMTGWYDDHQGGGFDSRGVVCFVFGEDDDDKEIFFESYEYAKDNWDLVE